MTAAFAASTPHNAAFIVYFNGIEMPAKSVSLRYGVWQTPEIQIEMAADPVLSRVGAEDRIQVAVFYLDDVNVTPETIPQFRLFGEGEITGWGYRNTSTGRSIVFTVVDQMSMLDQLFVNFMTSLDDTIAQTTGPAALTTALQPSSTLIYPYSLFIQGVKPIGEQGALITRPFDYLYNVVKGMIGAQTPVAERTVPSANFFSRWARLTNFHNRFVASPFFDETNDNEAVFPALRGMQNTTAVDVICRNLVPNLQNAGSLWNMVQLVYQTMLMEVAMIPGMPLVTVDLATSLVLETDFSEHELYDSFGVWLPKLRAESRATRPKRIPTYFAKPQMLFSVPPSCNALFPSQIKSLSYEENFRTQPTRLYFSDQTVARITNAKNPTDQVINNALCVGYPEAADLAERNKSKSSSNGRNFLLWPEEFFKGPVMDTRDVPPWLFFLEKGKQEHAQNTPDATAAPSTTPATPSAPRPVVAGAPGTPSNRIMTTVSNNGHMRNGVRVFDLAVEKLRDRVSRAIQGTSVPLDFALAWLNMESDGNINAKDGSKQDGSYTYGYWQLSAENARTFKTKAFPHGVQDPERLNDPNDPIAIDAGIAYMVYSRADADYVARHYNLKWSEGDMWRLTKMVHHGLGGFVNGGKIGKAPHEIVIKGAFTLFNEKYGRPPNDWAELYFEFDPSPPYGPQGRNALRNSTACGGVVPGASGTMISKSDPVPFTAPGAVGAPNAPTGPAAPFIRAAQNIAQETAPLITPEQYTDIQTSQLTVHQLYAKYEYFRERYAKRSGSAILAWNPYVVPGFPATFFDQRASRVDIVGYITTVQQAMSNDGQRTTSVSFMYGRGLHEMLDLLREEFDKGDSAAGAAPAEPIRDVRKVVQSFEQAETYYQRVFYGAQKLFGKDAAFDFRKAVGYAPELTGDAPVAIVIDGPDEATHDTYVEATQTANDLNEARKAAAMLVVQLKTQLHEHITQMHEYKTYLTQNPDEKLTTLVISKSDVESEINRLQAAANEIADRVIEARNSLAEIDGKLTAALDAVNLASDPNHLKKVIHNCTGDRELVPLPAAKPLFDSYDAAMRFNWRPICTLDEYVVFYNSAAEGEIPAFGHPQSVGARYFDRIRTLTAPSPGYEPPPDVTGFADNATGVTPADFPQTRANWDEVLLAYRRNVLTVKAPRT